MRAGFSQNPPFFHFFAGGFFTIFAVGYKIFKQYETMLRQTIRWAAVAALLFGAVSCSKDETPGDPEGTVLLNMYNEQNGKTLLSDSDIYINDAGNFISPASCQLFMLGERSGLGGVRVTDLMNPAPEAAVMKKYGYVAVRGAAAYMFPSQCVALPVDPDRGVNYLKFYVVDRITDPERGDLGAVVKFAIEAPRSYWLPEWGSTPYEIDYSSKALGDEVALTLPGDNFEAELYGNGELSCEKRGRKLVFVLHDWPSYGDGSVSYTLRLRVGESFTEVNVLLRY